ncbi:MAG: hypothetical protein ABGX16_22015 [Pirellulales bacterium]
MKPTETLCVTPSRREFVKLTTSAFGALTLTSYGGLAKAVAENRHPKVAAIFTAFSYRWHAHVILENFLEKYLFNGKLTDSGCDVVSFYADQIPAGDMSRSVARQYNIRQYHSIDEALCLGGSDLAVDAVLSIGEHGDYPSNELDQHMYPRKEFFDQIVAVMKRSNKFVPIFNDKHLSYRWDWAKEMVDTANELDIPLMAGSSVPLAERQPPLEIPASAEIEEAISIHGGGVESYDFHALEVLQSMVESRRGGETGVRRVEFLDNEALWKAADEGRWSVELAKAALESNGQQVGDLKALQEKRGKAYGIIVEYHDGLKGLALRLAESGTKWHFACRLKGNPRTLATSFYVGPWENRKLFSALSHAIQYHFIHRKAPYPVERTLLTTGILDASMHSRHEGGKPLDTPELKLAYDPRDYRAMREMGASWKILHEGIPQPEGVDPLGFKP